tara:strand:+ start:66 stop:332 length:267 start_codon:yes stop_codon:yes gene_type:complete
MSDDSKKTYSVPQSDGSLINYDVDKFSEEGQSDFQLLGQIQIRKEEARIDYMILVEGEKSLIEKLKSQLKDENILKEQDDNKDSKAKT